MNRIKLFQYILLFLCNVLIQSAAPVVIVESYPLQYSYYSIHQSLINAEDSPMLTSSSLSLTDTDSTNIVEATIDFTSGFKVGDILAFINQNSIVGSFDASTGIMTLSGSASVAHYETALRSIIYQSSSAHEYTDAINSHTKTLRFQVVDDANENSAPVTRNVLVTTPKMVYTDAHQGRIVRIIP